MLDIGYERVYQLTATQCQREHAYHDGIWEMLCEIVHARSVPQISVITYRYDLDFDGFELDIDGDNLKKQQITKYCFGSKWVKITDLIAR